MSSFVFPLLTDIKHRMADDPYAADRGSGHLSYFRRHKPPFQHCGAILCQGVNHALCWALLQGQDLFGIQH